MKIIPAFFTLILAALALNACRPNSTTTLREAKVSSLFLLESPKLTEKETDAVGRYLDRANWIPIPLSGPNGIADYGGFRPFGVSCLGKSRDGKQLIATIQLYDDFTPFAIEGEDTPEYRKMAEVLKDFRKRTPLKLDPDYDKALKEATKWENSP